jgi:hypothetical protein
VQATGPTDRGSGPPGSRVACRCLSVGFDRQQIDVVVSPSCDLFCCIVHVKLIYVMDALLSHFFSSKVPWVLKQARVEVSFELQALLQKKAFKRYHGAVAFAQLGGEISRWLVWDVGQLPFRLARVFVNCRCGTKNLFLVDIKLKSVTLAFDRPVSKG